MFSAAQAFLVLLGFQSWAKRWCQNVSFGVGRALEQLNEVPVLARGSGFRRSGAASPED